MIRHRRLRHVVMFAIAAALAVASLLSRSLDTSGTPSVVGSPPLVGFSFSPSSVENDDSSEDFRRLLDELQPDLVRLPIYWEQVNPTPETFDFSQVDRMIRIVADHNQLVPVRSTRIVLVVGARNFVYPEVHVPAWIPSTEVRDLERLSASPDYHTYVEMSIRRYAALPSLYAWQIENEPLDNVGSSVSSRTALPPRMLQSEIEAVRKVDGIHPIVVTTYNSDHVALDRIQASPLMTYFMSLRGVRPVGHPSQALALGDALGLDLYVVGPWVSMMGADQRIAWKQQTLDYWSGQSRRKGKQVWVTEMQGSPWRGVDGFTPSELVRSARAYQGHGASVVLLWGVEDWLGSPDWMSAGAAAFQILRSGGSS